MFIKDFQNGLKEYFNQMSSLKQSVTVTDMFMFGHTIKEPEIQIGAMNNSTVARFETFDRETICSIPIQITIYTGQINVDGNALNKIDSANFFSDEIKKWIINNAKKSKDIKTIRRINESTAQPLGNSGANIYTKSLRYDITAYNK